MCVCLLVLCAMTGLERDSRREGVWGPGATDDSNIGLAEGVSVDLGTRSWRRRNTRSRYNTSHWPLAVDGAASTTQ